MHIACVIGIIVGAILLLVLLKIFVFNGGKNVHFPDLSGKIIVITGANTGLGYISVLEMAKLNPQKIILACRSEERGNEAINKVKAELMSSKKVTDDGKADCLEFMRLDLNDLNSVREFAQNFNAKYDKLDILLNNAGIMALPQRETTAQGFEKQFGVNHVGHFLLTKLLLDKIKASPEGRVVNLSSGAHEGGLMNFDDLQHEKNYNGIVVYCQSKLANILFSIELDNQLKKEGISHVKVCSLHPGVVRTELGRYMQADSFCIKCCYYTPIFFYFTKTPWQGTQTQLHCCLVPFEQLQSGKYYMDCKVRKEKFKGGVENVPQEAAKLWQVSEEMVKEFI